jgi:predicted MFS family arabinose efflux permease
MSVSADTTQVAPSVPEPRSRLVTRPLLLRFVSILGSSTSFFLLLSVIPKFSEARAGRGAAGASTTALMAATVLGELVTPWLVARRGYRAVLAGGLALLGLSTLGFLACHDLASIVAVCALRGLGFAATIVAGGALTVSLLPADRRGEGLALVGIVSGLPSVLSLPLGVWIAARHGYPPVIVIGALSALIAVASVPGLPDRIRTAGRPVAMLTGLRTGNLVRPAAVFAVTAVAAGIIVTFLPLSGPGAGLVSDALLAQTLSATLIRMLVGRSSDRRGPGRLVLPGLLLSVAGMLVLTGRGPVAILGGATLFGAGFGVTQNAVLCLMYTRVSEAAYSTVSAIWNLAYDGGMGAGVIGFGVLADRCGYPWAFCITAALMLGGLLPWARDRTSQDRTSAESPEARA